MGNTKQYDFSVFVYKCFKLRYFHTNTSTFFLNKENVGKIKKNVYKRLLQLCMQVFRVTQCTWTRAATQKPTTQSLRCSRITASTAVTLNIVELCDLSATSKPANLDHRSAAVLNENLLLTIDGRNNYAMKDINMKESKYT